MVVAVYLPKGSHELNSRKSSIPFIWLTYLSSSTNFDKKELKIGLLLSPYDGVIGFSSTNIESI